MSLNVPNTLQNSKEQYVNTSAQSENSGSNKFDKVREIITNSRFIYESKYENGEISSEEFANAMGKINDALIRLDTNKKKMGIPKNTAPFSSGIHAFEQDHNRMQQNKDRKEVFLTMERVNKAHWDISRGLEGNSSRSVRDGEVKAMMLIKRESKTDAAVEEGILQFEVTDYITKFKKHFDFTNPESEGQWAKKSYFDSGTYGYPIDTFIGRYPLSNVRFNSENRKILNSILVGIYLNHPEDEEQLFNFMATKTGAVDAFTHFKPQQVDVQLIDSFKESVSNNIVSAKNLKSEKSAI